MNEMTYEFICQIQTTTGAWHDLTPTFVDIDCARNELESHRAHSRGNKFRLVSRMVSPWLPVPEEGDVK